MYTATGSSITVTIGVLAICLAAISPAGTWAAEPIKQEKKAKKPAQTHTSALAPKATGPKFASAETAGKAQACFGEAPKLNTLTPDEGKAGDKVTITGTNFGAAACLRGVSFGPGHPAQFQQTNDSITTTVPSGGKKGMVLLTVTTASGENSKPFLVKKKGEGSPVVLLLAERAHSEGARSTRALEDRPGYPVKRDNRERGSTI
jgi:hypothetical protein